MQGGLEIAMADYVLEGPKWGSAGLGTAGGIVTWAIDATIPATFLYDLSSAFADWAHYANIQFQEVASTASAEIDFSLGAIDGLDNILGETSYVYSGSQFSSASVEFDSGEGWHAAGSEIVSNDSVNLFNVALHEIGHAIGLGHYNAAPAIMNAVLDPNLTDLQQSDIDGVQALYGLAPLTPSAFQVAGAGDFNHSGVTDLLFQDPGGAIATWQTNPAQIIGDEPSGYHVVAAADLNGDGTTDVLFQNSASGFLAQWQMGAGQVAIAAGVGQAPSGFNFAGTGDINHDGTSDILFQNPSNGVVAAWLMNNGHIGVGLGLGTAPSGFTFAGTGDFNGDGTTDILFQNQSNGVVAVWEMNAGHVAVEAGVGTLPSGFKVAGAGDFNNDGTTDVLLQNATGFVAEWIINQGHVSIEAGLGQAPANSKIAGMADVNHDGTPDVLFQDTSTNAVHAWEMMSGHVSAQTTLDWLLA
jgi:Matrixin/FG-GAP-like repeat